MKRILVLCLLLAGSLAQAQLSQNELDSLSETAAVSYLPLLKEFIGIANDANYPDDIEKNIYWCEEAFESRGFQVSRIPTARVPVLLAEKVYVPDAPTYLIYLQVDGQPVDTSYWQQSDPYALTLKRQTDTGNWEEIAWENLSQWNDDWRVFGRSVSDAKGPIIMFLAALDVLQQRGLKPSFNIKVVMDFEEELGSPRLAKAVAENREILKAEGLLIFDGPRHSSNRPTLIFGARGIALMSLTTYGPITPQHSGHYGNYAPNPAFMLSQLLASMKDEDGRVTIPGFYESVQMDEATREILKSVPDDEAEILERLQLARAETVGRSYQEAIQYPSLNINGMQSAWINEKRRTIVPAWAKAELDIRLVPDSDPEKLIGLVESHIASKGYQLLQRPPTKEERLTYKRIATFNHRVAYPAFRTDLNSDMGQWLTRSLTESFSTHPVLIRMTGGSVPIAPFVSELGIPAIIVPTVNADNNQHSPNENLRLGNFKEGIKTMLGILARAVG